MIELALRSPVTMSPGQTRLVLFVLAGILLALLAGGLLETVFSGSLGLLLRLTGHRPPARDRFSTALDELEARLDRKEGDAPSPPGRSKD